MDASKISKGQSVERTEGRIFNPPGIYVHKESGAEFITSEGEEGIIQADALMSPIWKDGWERVGDVPTRLELLERRKAQEIKDAKEEALRKKAEEAELKAAVDKAIEAEEVVEAKLPKGGANYEPSLAK